jgi:hypothetical protein
MIGFTHRGQPRPEISSAQACSVILPSQAKTPAGMREDAGSRDDGPLPVRRDMTTHTTRTLALDLSCTAGGKSTAPHVALGLDS